MSRKPTTSRLMGRDARDGRFVSVPAARRDPDHTVVERLPLPGFGDSSDRKGK